MREVHRAASTLRLLIVAALAVALTAASSGRAGTALLLSANSGSGNSRSATVSATAIAAGADHSCALTSTGGVKCWGLLRYGSLTPVDVSGLSGGVVAIAARSFHSCALTSIGGVKCWGSNYYGQLGDGTTSDRRLSAVDVSGLSTGVTAIAVGGAHSCALTSSGGVKCWGYNRWGELGDGTTVDRLSPVDVSGLSSGVIAIAAGGYYSCALTSVGGVKCWGDGGELGDGTITGRSTPGDVSGLSSGVIAIAAGGAHSCALTSVGGVRCWGNNGAGQLGDGTTSSRLTPVDVSGLSSGVIAIAAGGEHSCALTSTGSVECWGANFRGELGDGTRSPARFVPAAVSSLTRGMVAIAAGDEHSCALTSTGGVKCWGRDDFGELGDGTTAFGRWTPVGVIGFGTAEATLAIVSGSVTVTPARVAAVNLRCGGEAGCHGTLTLFASVSGKLVGSSARRVQVKLGSRTFSIAAGLTQAVEVDLTARGFKVLVRVRLLPTRVAVRYQQPAGGTTAATRTITLTAPKAVKSKYANQLRSRNAMRTRTA